SAAGVDPSHIPAQQHRITALGLLRRFEEAEAVAKETTSAHPHEPELRIAFGNVLIDQYRYEDSLCWFDEAIKARATVDGLRGRAKALRRLRRFTDAETTARKSIEIWPDDPDPFIELGWVYDGWYRYEPALAAYEQALTIDPANAAAL